MRVVMVIFVGGASSMAGCPWRPLEDRPAAVPDAAGALVKDADEPAR